LSVFDELKRRNVLRVAAAYGVAAWLIIQIAETIFPLFGFDNTPARIVVILLAIGIVPALIFAWAFELTPQGLMKESEVDRSVSITAGTGKKLDRTIMVLLALALGYFAFDKFILGPQRDATVQRRLAEQLTGVAEEARREGHTEALIRSYGDRSIAVLAFADMSQDKDQEYLSDGIAEELLNLLARVPELRVISRSSAFSYKGKDIKIADVARELGVAHILEGSVRKVANRVRITVQLIEARSDTHLWSEIYDRNLHDLFAIQEEIATSVVDKLKITLLGDAPRARKTDPGAYSLFLQARYLGRLGNADDYERAIVLLGQVLDIDPTYSAAWVGLSRNYINQAGAGLRPVDEGLALAREATAEALSIDPKYAPAHADLGWIAMVFDNDLATAARHYERALALDPADVRTMLDAAYLLIALGRLDQSIALVEFAVSRDPINTAGHINLGRSYHYAGRWDDAISAYRTALLLNPGRLNANYGVGEALLMKGEAEAALQAFAQEQDDEYRVKGIALAMHALGRQTEYDNRLAELIDRWGQEWPSEVAQVHAFTGDVDGAFVWLNKAIAQNEDGLTEQFLQPLYAPIRADPRWTQFLEHAGHSPAVLDSIEFAVTLPEGGGRTSPSD